MEDKEVLTVTGWDPFREVGLFRGLSPFRDIPRLGGSLPEAAARWAPSIDVAEDDDNFVVTVELAGAKKDDVTLEVHDNVLTIRGEKRSEREEKNEQRRYVERCFGSFSRSFTLPTNANGEKVHASYADGVLTVEIPKREESKPRTIAVR
jgi:HSP20 family protein